jgi:hypothetical protein
MSARRWASVAVVAVVALGGLTSVGLANQPGRSAASARIAKAHPSVTFPIRAERCRWAAGSRGARTRRLHIDPSANRSARALLY